MKIGVMQPYFVPYIGYWQLINLVDKFVIYDDVNYIKQGWINRNNILVNGKIHQINLIINGVSSNKKINDLYIADDKIYREKLLKTIASAYRKAPYYNEVMQILERILLHNEKNLAYFLGNSLIEISGYLGIETEIMFSSYLNKNNELKGQDKIIDICKMLNATTYVNAIGGKALYDKNTFKKNKMELLFLNSNPVSYQPSDAEYIGNLSIVDVMMNCSKAKIRELLNQYILE